MNVCDEKRKEAKPKEDTTFTVSNKVLYNKRYKCVTRIGSGSYSKVYKSRDQQNDELVALKFTPRKANWLREKEFNALVQCGKSRNKQYVIQLLDSFEVGCVFVNVTPFYPTTVYDFTENDDYSLSIEDIRTISAQLLAAVNYLHNIHITHTDIKAENLLLCDASTKAWKSKDGKKVTNRLIDARIVLSDLDQAVNLGDGEFVGGGILCQTACYRAPEVVLKLPWGPAVDEFSCGVLIVELLIGDMLFQPAEKDTDRPTYEERLEHLRQIHTQLGEIPREMLRRSPLAVDSSAFDDCHVEGLPTAWEYAPKRPIYSELVVVAKQLMEMDPQMRLSARQALHMPVFSLFLTTGAASDDRPPHRRSTDRFLPMPKQLFPLRDDQKAEHRPTVNGVQHCDQDFMETFPFH